MTPFKILQNHYLTYLSKIKNTLHNVKKSLSHFKKCKQGEVYMVEILYNLSRKAIISSLCLIFEDQMKHSFFSYHSNWPFSFIPSCSIICVTAARIAGFIQEQYFVNHETQSTAQPHSTCFKQCFTLHLTYRSVRTGSLNQDLQWQLLRALFSCTVSNFSFSVSFSVLFYYIIL